MKIITVGTVPIRSEQKVSIDSTTHAERQLAECIRVRSARLVRPRSSSDTTYAHPGLHMKHSSSLAKCSNSQMEDPEGFMKASQGSVIL